MKTTAREIEEKIFQKEREQKNLQARLDYIYFNYGKENFNDDELDDFGGDYQYAIETLSGEIEMLKNEILELRNELEDDEDEKAEAPIENNLTVNVLAINGKGKITFNGKIVSKTRAMEELANAHNLFEEYENETAVLYIDENIVDVYKGTAEGGLELADKGKVEFEGAVRVADFGRDEIPHVNEKVNTIIAEYRAKAKAEDEEKARRESYKASLEGRLEELQLKISCVEDEIRYGKKFIANQQKRLISYQSYIAEVEDEITETGLEIEKAKVAIEKYKAEKVQLEDSIRNKAMNAVAAEIEDDETVADTYVEEEDEETVADDDDEEEEMTIAAATFDLDRFSEDAPEVTELKEVVTAYKTRCEAEGKLRDKVDEINAKYDAQEAALRKKLKALEDARYLEIVAAYDELESLGSLHELRNKANAQIETLIEGDTGIKLTENNFGTEKIWKGEKFKMSYLGIKKELMIEIGGRISTYKTVEGFVNAVVGLANAINRGDSEYTFPAA